MEIKRRFMHRDGSILYEGNYYDGIHLKGDIVDCFIKTGYLKEIDNYITGLSKGEILEQIMSELSLGVEETLKLLCKLDRISLNISNHIFLKAASKLLDKNHKEPITEYKRLFYISSLSREIKSLKVSDYNINDIRKIAFFRTSEEARMVLNLVP